MSNGAPYPADIRAKGWRFELDHERIRQSDTWALASADQRPWLLMLWLTAWEQTPCGSLPSSDELIAARIGMPVRTFVKNKPVLMRGWIEKDDGRLYNATMTERVLEMMATRRKESDRKALARLKSSAESCGSPEDVPRDKQGTDMGLHPESDTGTGTGTSNPVPDGTVVNGKPLTLAALPDCPHRRLIELFTEALPELPRPKVELWDGKPAEALRARWKWVLTATRTDRSRYATNAAEALDWFERFFGYVADSDFLMGRTGGFKCTLQWLVVKDNFSKVVQGNYENNAAVMA